MPDEPELTMRSRGVGLNWYPCFVCGHGGGHGYPAQADMASFVKDRETGQAIVNLFDRVGFKAFLDERRASESRFQVKMGACGEHEPNLNLLMMLLMESPRNALTWQRLILCRPGERNKPYPAEEIKKADDVWKALR